jgi:photosystem II stability/assembly factor-like uncharacterized protein
LIRPVRPIALALLVVAPLATPAEAADRLERPALAVPLAARSLLLDVARAGARLVAVGERGHVLLSDDEGATWRQAKSVPMRTMLTAVWFADARRGWAVGHDELILNTADGGETWTRSHYAPESQQPLLDVWFADTERGIAVGAYGAYYSTNDGGQTWTGRRFAAAPARGALPPGVDDGSTPDHHLNRIAGAGGRLWIAAEAGQLYRSDDVGATWSTLVSPYNGSWFGLLPLDRNSVFVFGLRGHLYRSNDGGASWRMLDSGVTAMLTDGVQLDDGSLALVGLAGTVLRSRDGGTTWVATQQEDRRGLSAVVASRSGALVTVGERGTRRVPR